eukprot:4948952-Lingulodinium_polyedra.AAC.1
MFTVDAGPYLQKTWVGKSKELTDLVGKCQEEVLQIVQKRDEAQEEEKETQFLTPVKDKRRLATDKARAAL